MKKLNEAIERFAYKHPRFGIPNLMRFIVIGNVAVYFLLRMSSFQAISFLGFNWNAVLHGEVWRLITFVFVPDESNPFGLIISLYFYYFMGNLLEQEWGTPKFNLYFFSGVALTVLTGIIGTYATFGAYTIYGTYYVNMSMFLALAALYPDMRVLLFFIIPIKVKWLAIADALLFGLDILAALLRLDFVAAALPVIALFNFLAFFWTDLTEALGYRRQVARYQTSHKTIQFKAAVRRQQQKEANQGYHHKCAVCGRTDTEFPDLEFRYCSKCAGYHCFCQDHIYNHVHFT